MSFFSFFCHIMKHIHQDDVDDNKVIKKTQIIRNRDRDAIWRNAVVDSLLRYIQVLHACNFLVNGD